MEGGVALEPEPAAVPGTLEPEPEPEDDDPTSVSTFPQLLEGQAEPDLQLQAGDGAEILQRSFTAAEADATQQPTGTRRRSLSEMATHSVSHIPAGLRRGNSNATELDALVGADKGGRSDSEIKAWLEEILPMWQSDEQLRQSKVCPDAIASLLVHALLGR